MLQKNQRPFTLGSNLNKSGTINQFSNTTENKFFSQTEHKSNFSNTGYGASFGQEILIVGSLESQMRVNDIVKYKKMQENTNLRNRINNSFLNKKFVSGYLKLRKGTTDHKYSHNTEAKPANLKEKFLTEIDYEKSDITLMRQTGTSSFNNTRLYTVPGAMVLTEGDEGNKDYQKELMIQKEKYKRINNKISDSFILRQIEGEIQGVKCFKGKKYNLRNRDKVRQGGFIIDKKAESLSRVRSVEMSVKNSNMDTLVASGRKVLPSQQNLSNSKVFDNF